MKKDEEKVIKMLATKANESIDQIAKKCGFSRQKVWRIIKRLEENNTIWGYHAVIDEGKLNMRKYLMLIKAAVKPFEDIVEAISKEEASKIAGKIGITVEYSSFIHGPYHWIFCFYARDTKHAKKFSHILCKTYADYVVDTIIMEKVFPIRKCGFINPNMNKLKEFSLFR